MNIEEAIKHCEEVAEAEEQKYKEWKGDYSHLQKIDSCKECASEHRQLANWLRELKALKDFANFVAESVLEEDFEENNDFYAEVFCRKLHKMGLLEATDDKWILNEEVNADADSD
jgi:hypothetical protein